MIHGPTLPPRVNYTGIGHFPRHHEHPFVCLICKEPKKGKENQVCCPRPACQKAHKADLWQKAEAKRKRRALQAALQAARREAA
jgi:hypothetical protein